MNKTIAFVGPLPPPVGGVALANMRFQTLIKESTNRFNIIELNTSRGLKNADLYKRKGLVNFFHFLKNLIDFFLFLFSNKIHICNVFVVPNISFLREAIFIIILKLTQKKIFIHLHSKTSGDLFLEGFRLKFFTSIISMGDIVFVLSEEYHKPFFLKYISSKKLVVLENFINVQDFENEIQNKKLEFLYVGRVSEKKGFLDLLNAISILHKQFPKIKINVLGEFENKDFQRKVNDTLKRNCITCFRFHGMVMGKDKLRFFKESSILLFPSHFENSPIVLKEAIASKLAIIASDIIENRQILDSFGCKMYFKVRDHHQLSEKIKTLLENKIKLKAMMDEANRAKIFDYHDAKKAVNLSFQKILKHENKSVK
tara:strand:- start:1437 stop:2546 length:1110 start_codon:yes stop_codon:yes gene_type:complete